MILALKIFTLVDVRIKIDGRSCSTHGCDEKLNIVVEKLEGKGPLDDIGVDRRIILKCTLRKSSEKDWTGGTGRDWIDLAQDKRR
jgi:hypothetical protein